LTVASPTEVDSDEVQGTDFTGTTSASLGNSLRRFRDYWRTHSAKSFFAEVLGLTPAHAQNAGLVAKLAGQKDQGTIGNVLNGSNFAEAVGLSNQTKMNQVFTAFGSTSLDKANCYGPSVSYQKHPDAQTSDSNFNGQFPSGDLGMWLPRNPPTGDACAAAQFNAIMQKPRIQVNFMLKMAAAAMASSGVPAAGETKTVTTAMNAKVSGSGAGISFDSATVSRASQGGIYRIDFVMNFPTSFGTGSRKVHLSMSHTPTKYSGVTVSEVTWGQILRTAAAHIAPVPPVCA
jgi:hypothetical protein